MGQIHISTHKCSWIWIRQLHSNNNWTLWFQISVVVRVVLPPGTHSNKHLRPTEETKTISIIRHSVWCNLHARQLASIHRTDRFLLLSSSKTAFRFQVGTLAMISSYLTRSLFNWTKSWRTKTRWTTYSWTTLNLFHCQTWVTLQLLLTTTKPKLLPLTVCKTVQMGSILPV